MKITAPSRTALLSSWARGCVRPRPGDDLGVGARLAFSAP
jgi:hypothetical protein